MSRHDLISKTRPDPDKRVTDLEIRRVWGFAGLSLKAQRDLEGGQRVFCGPERGESQDIAQQLACRGEKVGWVEKMACCRRASHVD